MISQTPCVAVITRTKNRPLLLRRAITSVLQQTQQDWIHVIVNDGGDATVVENLVHEKASAYSGRVRIVHSVSSLGMEAASNIGLKESDSAYVTLLDDDDSWHPAFLSKCIEALREKVAPSVKGVVTHSCRIVERVESGTCTDRIRELRREKFNHYSNVIGVAELLAGNVFPVNSFVYERDVLETVGIYREDLPVLGDWEFNLRFIKLYDIQVVPLELSYFHTRAHLKTGSMANTVTAGRDQHRLYATLIRNDWLRKDLARGTVGFGALLSVHGQIKLISSKIQALKESSVEGLLLKTWRRWKRRIES